MTLADIRQDEDVLDTWFSSWLWPFSVFDGLESNEEVDYYYPTSVLVTGWDIIFLWVARMIMAGYEWKNEYPFKHVYFTGMVRDKQRRKMSKSLGNSPDPVALMNEYGADGVRFGMLSSSPAGGDLLFDVKLCEQGRNFTNKIWNALRLLKHLESTAEEQDLHAHEEVALQWLEGKLSLVCDQIDGLFKEYKLSEALMQLYSFIWSDFCSGFLEMIKPGSSQNASSKMIEQTYSLLERMMTVLHPFMPFISEEIWHQIKRREQGDDCMISQWPALSGSDRSAVAPVDRILAIVNKVRDVRNQYGLKQKEKLTMIMRPSENQNELVDHANLKNLLLKMAILEEVQIESGHIDSNTHASFVIGADQYFVHVGDTRNIEEEIKKLEEEIKYQKGFVAAAEKKLSNERFVNNAPEAVVNKERQKLADGKKRIELLQKNLLQLQQ